MVSPEPCLRHRGCGVVDVDVGWVERNSALSIVPNPRVTLWVWGILLLVLTLLEKYDILNLNRH